MLEFLFLKKSICFLKKIENEGTEIESMKKMVAFL
jgi:hypothetical protein